MAYLKQEVERLLDLITKNEEEREELWLDLMSGEMDLSDLRYQVCQPSTGGDYVELDRETCS